jgi:hypothetical protein
MEKIKKAVEAEIVKSETYTQIRSVPRQGDPEGYWRDYYLQIGRKQAFDEVAVMLSVQSQIKKVTKKKKTGDK